MHEDESSPDPEAGRSVPATRERELPPADALLDALADRRRRRVLRYLSEADEADTGELADVLVGWRLEPRATLGQDARESVTWSLRHVHLPKLDELGLVAYDDEAGSVSLASLPDPVWDVVASVTEYETAAVEVDDRGAQ